VSVSVRDRLGKRLDPLLDQIRRIATWCAWAGGAILFAAALLITVEVVIRKLFDVSMGGADELSGYGFAIVGTFAFGYAMLDRGHIRVDTAYAYLGRRGQALLDVAAALLLLVFFALLLRYGFSVVAATWRMDAHSNTPLHVALVLPQLFWWLGLCLTFVITVLLLVRALLYLAAGDFDASRRLIGSQAMEEEIAAELKFIEATRAEGEARR
jgi:TRAP-type C4-dicarboxylate transport system permease small subunit